MTRSRIKRLKVLPETKDALLKHHATRSVADKKAVDKANLAELIAELVANGAALGSVKVRQDSIIRGSARASHPSRTPPQEGAQ